MHFAGRSFGLKKALVFIVLSLVLMLLDVKSPAWIGVVRANAHASMQPLYALSSYPRFAIDFAQGLFLSKESLRRENIRLHAQLLHANVALQSQDYLLAQNARLQGLLSVKPAHSRLAKVMGQDANPLKQVLVVDKGQEDGVQIGQVVVDAKGVLGQVVNVYAHTARVLLITDEEQSVAVLVARTGQRAMVSGRGDSVALNLDHVFKSGDVVVGDTLISSGLGGRIPAGYKVGTISTIDGAQGDNFAGILVTPAADFRYNDFVLILQNQDPAMHAPQAVIDSEFIPQTMPSSDGTQEPPAP